MTMKKHLYLDLHVLQTVPPSCVNRDDTGSPKTALYGGATRARVSSQAWKHAIRMMFREMLAPEQLGQRTKRIVGMVEEKIRALSPEADARKLAKDVLTRAGLSLNAKNLDKGTDALFFMSNAQAEALARIAVEEPEKLKDKDACKNALANAPSVDIALFGRMVASTPSLGVDASAQVAHAISTHAVRNEFDYFTAVDDRAPEDTAGAGHLGTVEFNSSTLYRYACVDVLEFAKMIQKGVPQALSCFAEAFLCSMPTGKQNTFANRTQPDDVYIVLREDFPMSLVNAFEQPVPAGSAGGYLAGSEKRLVEHAQKLYKNYGEPVWALAMGQALEPLAESVPMRQMLDRLEAELEEVLNKGGAE